MEAYARAGIDFSGSVLRYAEVEQYGRRFRLLRLGSCDFDFDIAGAVLGDGKDTHLSTISEALADVFAGSVATSYQVTLHPPGCYSFFTPLPANLTDAVRKVRLQQEASLLAGVETPLRLTADALFSEHVGEGERLDWVHVLAVPEHVHARFDRVLKTLPQPRHRFMLSMQAAAAAAGRLLPRETPPPEPVPPHLLVVGWYPDHVEYTLCRDRRWIFSHFIPAGTAADAAYYAVALLQRLGLHPTQVGRLYLYGSDLQPDALPLFERIFGRTPERLNPLVLVDLDAGSLTADFDAEAYVPCMGAAL